jgi:hypothetical protein
MRAVLLEVPKTQEEWDRWTQADKLDHDLIRQAILKNGGPNLGQYPLDPLPWNAVQQYLAWVQQTHNEMNSAIGAQGSDLQDTDLTDARQLEAWVWLHYQEQNTAGNILKVA